MVTHKRLNTTITGKHLWQCRKNTQNLCCASGYQYRHIFFITKSCKKFTVGHIFLVLLKNAIIFFSGLVPGLLNVREAFSPPDRTSALFSGGHTGIGLPKPRSGFRICTRIHNIGYKNHKTMREPLRGVITVERTRDWQLYCTLSRKETRD